jgi:hypothetical protein
MRMTSTADYAYHTSRSATCALAAGWALMLIATIGSVWCDDHGQPSRMITREQIISGVMRPYIGQSLSGVDASTMRGKVLCGYQGWFAAQGDGLGRGWYHWQGRNGFKPGSCSVDLWPDVSELDPDERYATPFTLRDGRTAQVYSAYNAKTVYRHFAWMREYGIDGVLVQRFASEIFSLPGLTQFTTVLANCRAGANRNGRVYAVMYDLSGIGPHDMDKVKADWTLLVDKMHITSDPAYLHDEGRPVVAVWGIGFNDGRRYTLAQCHDLVEFLKRTPAGGCTVMLGVPTWWRTLQRDSVPDTALHDVLLAADIVSPWSIGRCNSPASSANLAKEAWIGDEAWCTDHHKEFLPVVFPGFSWHNLHHDAPSNAIPRLGGRFLWSQYLAAKRVGATMVYQAMFDEMDEGTAIFKCTNSPPVGESTFLDNEGLPSDHYLKLVGAAAAMIRGTVPDSDDMPNVEQDQHP